MKKIRLTFLMLMTFMMSLALQAQQTTIDFETGDMSQLSGLTVTNDATYPWAVVELASPFTTGNTSAYALKSTNEGVANTTSSIEISFTYPSAGTISFLGGCWGEGSYTAWDKCVFKIDGEQQFGNGALARWDTYLYEVSAGTHTFTWEYTKDNTTDPTGDAFLIDDLVFGITTCARPTELAYSDVTTTSAVLSWTAGGSEPKWTLEVSDGETTYTIPDITENPYTLEGLTSATTYTVKVKANCTDEDASEWSNSVAFTTECVTVVVTEAEPFIENFSNDGACWTLNEYVSGTAAWTIATTLSNNGAVSSLYDGACAKFYASNHTDVTKLVSPVLDLSALGSSAQLSFQMANAAWSGDINTMKVYYRTSAASEWVEIAYYEGTHVEWELQTLILPNTSATYQIAFEGIADYGYAIFIDDVTVAAAPACAAPSLNAAENITVTSATINWTANSGETEWTIEVNGEETTGITENPYTLEGLTPATNYTVRVKANCSEEDASDWSTAIAFRTSCTNIANLPWEENFEDFTESTVPDCWDNSASTSPTLDANPERIWGVYSYNNNQMLRMYNFFVQTGVALINSPAITLPVEGSYELIFKYSHLANCGEFSVKISNDGGNTFVEKGTYTANTTSYSYTNPGTFTEIEPISLAEYAGQSIIVQFYANANCSSGAIFVDDISIATPPTCFKPTDVTISDITTTSATIAWTDNNTTAPQGWTIEVNGTTQVAAATNPYTLEDLTVATIYTVRVKANCTDEDMSDWSDEVTFSTACGTIVVTEENPYNEGFEGADFGCWSTQVLSGTSDWLLTNQQAAVGTQSAGFPYSGDSSYLISPVFDLTQVSNVQLSFQHMHPEWTGDPASELYVYYRASETEEWTQIASYTTYYEEFTLETLTLPNTSATYQICFKGVGADGYNVFLDDVNISGDEPVVEPCATPTNVAVENGVVTWTGDAANYNVHIVAGETTIDTTVNAATYTIEGLNEGDHATVTVQAICDEENLSEWSEAVEFDYTVGINSYAISANIYPNPTTGNVTVESNAIGADLTVFDMFGKLMMTTKVAAERTELNFSGFATGVYMVRIANSNAITTVKVVKE